MAAQEGHPVTAEKWIILLVGSPIVAICAWSVVVQVVKRWRGERDDDDRCPYCGELIRGGCCDSCDDDD